MSEMCGLTGFIGKSNFSGLASRNIVIQMADALGTRGPDDSGQWIDNDFGIALAHKRLSILDLSVTGHQPMESIGGKYIIVFNGEIYNHLELRKLLESENNAIINWRGYSDTETLLAGFNAWGIKATIERCVGMFAFAVWDRSSHVLTLGRDRLGEKPLYYGWQGTGSNSFFLFGSELKSLKAHPAFTADICRDALSLLMRYGYIPAPYSIYKGIHKLTPGSLLSLSVHTHDINLLSYWSVVEVASRENAALNKIFSNESDLIDELDTSLRTAVKQQMLADVPIGAFLSGGVDSSTIVALMQAQSSRPVKTFTIGFNEAGYSEAAHARAVAAHLGTSHNEMFVTPAQALEVIPKLPILYCEPFADSSQIPTYLVSALARQDVTVALSGDGGDELFCGYNRYLISQNLWRHLLKVPIPIRNMLARGITKVPPRVWDSFFKPINNMLPNSMRHSMIGDKLHKGAGVIASNNIDQLYLGIISCWADPSSVVLCANEPLINLNSLPIDTSGLNDIQRMMLFDTISYLPDDILVKLDRASMGVSLESRAPFLDHRVVEMSWRIPQTMKIRDGVGKWALREVLYKYVPKSLIEKPKMGFGVPLDVWLRGPLREWAEELLDESRLRNEGFFNPIPIRQKWKEHLSGRDNWQRQLWIVLMFQSWLEIQDK